MKLEPARPTGGVKAPRLCVARERPGPKHSRPEQSAAAATSKWNKSETNPRHVVPGRQSDLQRRCHADQLKFLVNRLLAAGRPIQNLAESGGLLFLARSKANVHHRVGSEVDVAAPRDDVRVH